MGQEGTPRGGYSSLSVHVNESTGVASVALNRPAKMNALDNTFFRELPLAIESLDADPSVRVIVLSGNGRHFCAGIDLQVLSSLLSSTSSPSSSSPSSSSSFSSSSSPSSSTSSSHWQGTSHEARQGAALGAGQGGVHRQGGAVCEGRRREELRRGIKVMQAAISSLESCRKPVVASIHGACIGGGIDIITACDFRYSTETAFFSVKEVDLAIVADLGTLQRLPRIVGEGNARELALSARKFDAREALRLGLVQQVFASEGDLTKGVERIASEIARKSPLAVVGTKAVMNFCRDRSVDDGLEYTATWNSAMLLSSDIYAALQASARKTTPTFSRL